MVDVKDQWTTLSTAMTLEIKNMRKRLGISAQVPSEEGIDGPALESDQKL